LSHLEPLTPTTHEGHSAKPQITSIAFDERGEICVTAGEDEHFVTWDAMIGQ
jgi:COMPASS component SWD2